MKTQTTQKILTPMALLSLFVAALGGGLELEISAPGFPEMTRYFGVSEAVIGLTITYNLVGFCIAALLYGPLSEAFGRRSMMIMGNGLFALGALGCFWAPSMDVLLIARFIQGLGAATSAVLFSVMIADVYSVDKASKLYGFFNAFCTICMAIAPIIGGCMNAWVGWRGNYGIVAGLCVLGWILVLFFLPETHTQRRSMAIKQIARDYRQLLSHPLFLCLAIIPSICYAGYLAFVAIAPFLYREVFGFSMIAYMGHQALCVSCFVFFSFLVGSIMDRYGKKNTMQAGLWTLACGVIFLIAAPWMGTWEVYALTAAMCLFNSGDALLYPLIFARSMDIFPQIKGTASSVIMSLRYLLCAAITGMATYFYNETAIPFSLLMIGVGSMVIVLTLLIIKRL